MSTNARAFERGEPVGFDDIEGFVVLLDEGMKEVVPRQTARFSWQLSRGGATYQLTSSPHEFDIRGKAISYLAVGGGEDLMFVSPVAGRPVKGVSLPVC